MDRCGPLFLCLCLLAVQSMTAETSQALLRWMEKMEVARGRKLPSSFATRQVHSLEQMLLDVSFWGSNLTLKTRTIQSLAFKLGCNFTGLSLTSTALELVPQAWNPHAMQFPADLTREACRTRPRQLRLICIYYFTNYFFKDEDNSSLLNNYVLGAQLSHGPVENLRDPVNISFWHNQSLEGYTVTCVFWKEGAGKHHWGAWSSEGCRTEQPSPFHVLCHCNHLTYFAVLMQLSSAPVPAELLAPLTYISLVGCSISIVASLLTILLHLHARKQSDSTTRIHMNLHASVLLLNVAFLLSPALARPPVSGACTALAAALHYTLLSCLTWTAVEGVNLCLLLGRVYNVYIRRYMLKLCVLGWGVPALLVLLPLAVNSSVYGPRTISFSDSWENGTSFQNMSICWVRSPVLHSVLVMGYGGLTSLFNLVVLAWALWTLRRLRARAEVRSARACRDTVTVLGLAVLLGSTWALAFFSFGVFLLPQLFLFTIFNSLYGFFLFLWFCSQKCHSEAEAEAEMEAFSSSQTTPQPRQLAADRIWKRCGHLSAGVRRPLEGLSPQNRSCGVTGTQKGHLSLFPARPCAVLLPAVPQAYLAPREHLTTAAPLKASPQVPAASQRLHQKPPGVYLGNSKGPGL
ncbi:adhesion G-protein coupled receptor G5 [Carlito syrichta]|uniref:Adhesion G-protein coupled receptor G5 n=1 Tax=Carlito syrichta TaxID=1868482 RepID=A0A1U7UK53_CARSF|nr:adhesion G-protein coupled receptor G5 [Carlito syrichta]